MPQVVVSFLGGLAARLALAHRFAHRLFAEGDELARSPEIVSGGFHDR